jgi:hypothetical protein
LVTIGAAIGVRVWILTGPLGRVDGDEAIVGLMAMAFRHGHTSSMFWGQNYGGTIEPGLTGIAFFLTGRSSWALKLVPVALAGLAALTLWRVALRVLDPRAARFAAALALVYPPFFLWWSTKARGFYWVSLVLVLAALLYAMRLVADFRRRDVAIFGALLGVCWWTSPQTIFVLLPLGAWLAVRVRRHWRDLWPAVPAALVGAGPWLWWNLHHGWRSLSLPDSIVQSTYLGRLHVLFTQTVPEMLALRAPYTHDWLLGAVGIATYAAVLVAFVVFTVVVIRAGGTQRTRWEPLLAIMIGFPLVYALPSRTWYTGEPRYVLLLVPVAVILLCAHLTTVRRQVIALGIALVLATTMLSTIGHANDSAALKEGHPADVTPLIAALHARHIRTLYANYWIAYPITFESGQSILATSTGDMRDTSLEHAVDRSSPSTYVVERNSIAETRLDRDLRRLQVHYERATIGRFVIYTLHRRLVPEQLSRRPEARPGQSGSHTSSVHARHR